MATTAPPIQCVLADDLSGAAEIAGVAHRYGLSPQLILDRQSAAAVNAIRIYDTDSRLMAAPDAAARVADVVSAARATSHVFKKIDSLLRGPVIAEIDAAMLALGIATALLVPQNPSRGRCVSRGIYSVNGVPLHETEFRNDPDSPRVSADVRTLLGPARRGVVVLGPGESIVPGAINFGCAASRGDLASWAAAVNENVLPVGGVDFFTALLDHAGLRSGGRSIATRTQPRLIASGSASAYAKTLPELAAAHGIREFELGPWLQSNSVEDLSTLAEQIARAVRSTGRAVLCVGAVGRNMPGLASQLPRSIAQVVEHVYRATSADLFIDGGATAAAVLRHLDWRDLSVGGELTTGVVQLNATRGGVVTIKPGSYAWPESVWEYATSPDPSRPSR